MSELDVLFVVEELELVALLQLYELPTASWVHPLNILNCPSHTYVIYCGTLRRFTNLVKPYCNWAFYHLAKDEKRINSF